ncbi:MAG: glycoside hydrolase family 16 protein [Bacilli bacterium]
MKTKNLLLIAPLIFSLSSCDFSSASSSPTSDTLSASVADSASEEESTKPSVDQSDSDSQISSDISPEEEWKLTWSDEFNSDKLDTTNWSYQQGNGSDYGIWGWGNNEQQYYRKDNVAVKDGNLVITAKKESFGGSSYTSSRIRTAGLVSATYGKIEARISLPAGNGLWPAFWMLPETQFENQGWPHNGEIDIMEAKGRLTNQTSSALHFANNSNQHYYVSSENVFKLTDYTTIEEYHNYGVIWTKDSMSFYCDDNDFLTINRSKWQTSAYSSEESGPFDQPFHILFNMAVGGNFDGNTLPPDDFTSAEMKVDYVRIYSQRN